MISTIVTGGDDVKASEYNNLRVDIPHESIIVEYGGASAPIGWLICDGSSLLVADYPDLFAIIGYTFGGAGLNFSIPDLRDILPIGKSGTKAIGSTGGADTHSLSIAEMPTHSHTITEDTANHKHTIYNDQGSGTYVNGFLWHISDGGAETSQNSGNSTSHVHTGYTGYEGGAAAFNIIPAYQATNFIIKY